jgi:hypothetical protein
VIAFCQWTIFSGSYVALSSKVCSIERNSARRLTRCQAADVVNAFKTIGLALVKHADASTDNSPDGASIPRSARARGTDLRLRIDRRNSASISNAERADGCTRSFSTRHHGTWDCRTGYRRRSGA